MRPDYEYDMVFKPVFIRSRRDTLEFYFKDWLLKYSLLGMMTESQRAIFTSVSGEDRVSDEIMLEIILNFPIKFSELPDSIFKLCVASDEDWDYFNEETKSLCRSRKLFLVDYRDLALIKWDEDDGDNEGLYGQAGIWSFDGSMQQWIHIGSDEKWSCGLDEDPDQLWDRRWLACKDVYKRVDIIRRSSMSFYDIIAAESPDDIDLEEVLKHSRD